MAYRRYANLPGTQQYGLTRRQQRTTEEFEYNPNLSRASLSPDPSPASRSLAVSEAGGPSSIAIPGLEAEAVETEGLPADPPETPMTANQIEASARAIKGYAPNLGKKGIIDMILGWAATGKAKEGFKGMLANMLGVTTPFAVAPIEMALLTKNYIQAYNKHLADIESLEASEEARATNPEISQAEMASEDPEALSGRTPDDDPFSEPISQDEMMSKDPAPDPPPEVSIAPVEQSEIVGHVNPFGHDPGATTGPVGPSSGGGRAEANVIGLGGPAPGSSTGNYGGGTESGDGDSGDPTVLCTALYNMGRLDEKIYKADSEYADKYVDDLTYAGYAVWARHLAKSDKIVLLLSPLINSFANEMYSRLHGGKGSFVGKVIMNLGGPACKLIGKIMEIGNGRNYIKRIFGTARS